MVDVPPSLAHENWSLVSQSADFACLSALVAQCWDFVTHISDEVEYLWRGKFSYIKAVYFTSRYIMLSAQIDPSDSSLVSANQTLTLGLESGFSQKPSICPRIFAFKSIVCQLLTFIVEVVLLLRVYALCGQTQRARHFLITMFLITTSLETTGNALVIRSLMQGTGCVPAEISKAGIAIFVIGAGITQSVIVSTTVAKFVARMRAGRWARSPLISLVLREGVAVFLLVVVLVLSTATFQIAEGVHKRVQDAGFSWYLALFSIAGSRLVLNLRKLPSPQGAQHNPRVDVLSFNGDDPTPSDNSICLTTVLSE